MRSLLKKQNKTTLKHPPSHQVPLKDLRQRCIKFTVYDGNRGKHNVIIGYVIYPLKLYESYSRVMLWRDLQNDESSAQAIQVCRIYLFCLILFN